ncbi:MAG: S24 family peptidase [Streptococcus sp.]|nr:S24 family peptidase [Streptococcus sp.]
MARGRGTASPQDKEAMVFISKKLKNLLKEQGRKQIELAKETGIPASTITGYIKGTSLPVTENVEKIARFLGVTAEEIDLRYRLLSDIPQQFPELDTLYERLSKKNREKIIISIKKVLSEQELENKLKENYFPYLVYENYYSSQQKPEQADIVWFNQELDYDIALWLRTDSLEPKYPQNSVVLIKKTHFEFAGAIYAIDYDGQTIIKRVFNDATGIRLISLNKKYGDKYISYDEEPKVIGRVMATFKPLEQKRLK